MLFTISPPYKDGTRIWYWSLQGNCSFTYIAVIWCSCSVKSYANPLWNKSSELANLFLQQSSRAKLNVPVWLAKRASFAGLVSAVPLLNWRWHTFGSTCPKSLKGIQSRCTKACLSTYTLKIRVTPGEGSRKAPEKLIVSLYLLGLKCLNTNLESVDC